MENGKRWRILQREFFFLRLGTRLSWVLSLLMGEGEEKARLSPWLGPSPMLTSCLPQLPPASPAAAPLSLFVPSLSYSPLQTDRLAELLKLFLTLTMILTLTSSLTSPGLQIFQSLASSVPLFLPIFLITTGLELCLLQPLSLFQLRDRALPQLP